ncbi:hypothetical protein ACHAWX_002466 [Stephanocyclus meneghinianus]
MAPKTILLLSAALFPTAAAQNFPYEKPAKRYTPWQSLSSADQSTAESSLGYTPITWNVPALDPVEQFGWWQFTDAQKSGAQSLGLNEDQWDCFINHYTSYTWAELVQYDLSSAYETLGWSENSWEGNAATPASESKWWGQLTESEKEAANQLCYFQDNWNQVDMTANDSYFPFPFPAFRYVPWDELSGAVQDTVETKLGYTSADDWNVLGNNTAEWNTFLNLDETQRAGALDLGFYTHTWDCFVNHYDALYWDSLYGSLLTAVETLGWNEESWTTRSTATAPDTESTFWDDLSPQEKAAATALCYFKETWDGDDLTSFYDYSNKQTNAIPGNSVPSDMDFSIFAGEWSPGSNWVPGQAGQPKSLETTSSAKVVSTGALALAIAIGAFIFQ